MKKFEYYFFENMKPTQLKDIESLKVKLKDLGQDGWEMIGCGSCNEGMTHIIYFKREII